MNWTEKTAQAHLEKNYTNPGSPIAYAPPARIVDFYKGAIRREAAENLAHRHHVYTLFRQNITRPKNKVFNGIFARVKRELVELDLADVSGLADANEGVTFLLLAIDSLTRFLWVAPLKSKESGEVLARFKELHQKMNEKHRLLSVCSDLGREFTNRDFKAYLARHRIKHKHSFALNHCPTVERMMRTLKIALHRHLTKNRSDFYLGILPQIVDQINHRKHTFTKMSPAEAESIEGSEMLINDRKERAYAEKPDRKIRFPVNTLVRITKIKGRFHRGFQEVNQLEVFRVVEIDPKFTKARLYTLEDLEGEPLIGKFYAVELTRINPEMKFAVGKVLKRGKTSSLVNFHGLPKVTARISNQDIDESRTLRDAAVFQPLLNYVQDGRD